MGVVKIALQLLIRSFKAIKHTDLNEIIVNIC